MRFIFNLLSVFSILYLIFLFFKWYIKEHFGKNFIVFWICTLLCIYIYINDMQKIKQEQQRYKIKYETEYDNRSGQEIWTENMKDYDAVRGY